MGPGEQGFLCEFLAHTPDPPPSAPPRGSLQSCPHWGEHESGRMVHWPGSHSSEVCASSPVPHSRLPKEGVCPGTLPPPHPTQRLGPFLGEQWRQQPSPPIQALRAPHLGEAWLREFQALPFLAGHQLLLPLNPKPSSSLAQLFPDEPSVQMRPQTGQGPGAPLRPGRGGDPHPWK